MGYQMAMNQTPMAKTAYHIDKPLPRVAVRYLALMVGRGMSGGLHGNAMFEWLQLVHDLGYQPQMEVVSLLMLYFHAPHTDPFYCLTYQLLGATGVQAAQAMYKHDDLTPSQQKLLSFDPAQIEKMQYRQDNMIRYAIHLVTSHPTYDNHGEFEGIPWSWSPELTELFFKHFIKQATHYLYQYQQPISRFAYYWSLDIATQQVTAFFNQLDEFMRVWEQNTHNTYVVMKQKTQADIQAAQAILDFRQRMIAAITGAHP